MDRWIDPRIALADRYPGYDISELDHLIEDVGLQTKHKPELMRVLFETPSGFAIFGIDSGYLYDIGSDYHGTEMIWVYCVTKQSADLFLWLRGFLKLNNRSTAIGPDHIDDKLIDFIEEHCSGGEKLIVGQSAYKEAIGNRLGITCIYDDAVKELMWGLQNLLNDLVPEEKSEFSKQDHKYQSKELLGYLRTNIPDFDIKPEMINGQIALLASFMRHCDVACKECADILHSVDYHLERSGLKTDQWLLVTHATALMMLMNVPVLTLDEMFTDDELKKINEEAGKYDDKIIKANIQTIYNKVIRLNELKFKKLDELKIVLHKAKAASKGAPDSGEVLTELPQVSCPKRSCQDAERRGTKKLKVDGDDVDMV